MTTDSTVKKLELSNGNQRCVWVQLESGAWKPDWFYLGDEPHVRFKDHEWMSVGTSRALALELVEDTPTRKAFRGKVDYYGTDVACEVAVEIPESGAGFVVRSSFTPVQDVEILEALSSFETPYVHDGSESTLSVIGMEPVLVTSNGKKIAGIEWENPLWFYNRAGVCRMSGPTNAPYLAHEIRTGGGQRRVALILDAAASTFHDLYATPTRKVKPGEAREYDPSAEFRDKEPGFHGYKFIVGAFNWSSTIRKDPNLLVARGEAVTQRLVLDYAGSEDERLPEAWLEATWGRLLAMSMPEDGVVPAEKVARDLGVTWEVAAEALVDIIRQEEVPGLWSTKKGIAVYIDGTRPQAGGLDRGFTMLWLAPIACLARWRGDKELERRTQTLAEGFADAVAKLDPALAFTLGPCFFVVMPAMRLIALQPDAVPALAKAAIGYLDGALKAHSKGATPEGLGDYGVRAIVTHVFLLGARSLSQQRYADHALTMLDFINRQLDERFWFFGGGFGEKCPAGHQARPLGYSHAIYANLEAHRLTSDPKYLAAARRFANLLCSLCYATINTSPIADFDSRAWTNGAISGRDQLAEAPPFETCDALRSLAALAAHGPLPDAMYDLIWLAARTTLAMVPAARTHKRIFDTKGNVVYKPVKDFANERAIYARFPFVAYENPWDQTLQATYQGAEPLGNRLAWGGEVANAEDDRLLVFAPSAAAFHADGPSPVLCWNPLAKSVRTTIRVRSGPGAAPKPVAVEIGARQLRVL
jgi:hypothetical protein